jgi:hypothetical protein
MTTFLLSGFNLLIIVDLPLLSKPTHNTLLCFFPFPNVPPIVLLYVDYYAVYNTLHHT